jgi:predicted flavoprotein YhiN
MKAAPLLRAWLHRLREHGVSFHARHRWRGWMPDGRSLRFLAPGGELAVTADACLLALGGGSWARNLARTAPGSRCSKPRRKRVQPLRPANCGFNVAWSEHLRQGFAGAAVKNVAASHLDASRNNGGAQGEFLVTNPWRRGQPDLRPGAGLRDRIETAGSATLLLDLVPDRALERLRQDLERPRGRDSLANHLRRKCGIEGVKAALLREALPAADLDHPARLAARIKALPLRLIPRVRSTKPSAAPVAWISPHSMKTSCCAACPACSARAKCSTGKRPRGATCSPPAWPAVVLRAWG